jgi:hypothetical protein
MKYFVRNFFAGLMILALASAVTFAKVKRSSITFTGDTMVNGTLVKAGDYNLKFDEKTNELSILKGGKVMVTTTTTMRERTDKAADTQYDIKDNVLVSVAFSGERQDLVINQQGSQSGN